MRGILLVNKRPSWTSFDVVGSLKKVFHTGQIGHLGTLDPMATGVLAVTIGSATKLFDMFLNKTKTYVAEFTFGYSTDTLDAEGLVESALKDYDLANIKMLNNKQFNTTQNDNSNSNILDGLNKESNVQCVDGKIPSLDEINGVLHEFLGEIEQMPPKYSAKKINGKKAYELARNGKEFELKPAKVRIYGLKVLDYSNNVLKIEINCGAGTYIRSLGRDLATRLNSLCTMTKLTRTKLGDFELKDCIDIKSVSDEDIIDKLLPIDFAFNNLPIVDNAIIVQRLLNGQTVKCEDYIELSKIYKTQGEFRLYLNNEFVALACFNDDKAKMTKYFAI